jgi:hypothetical protein
VAFSLGYPLPDELKHSMVLLGREQLAGKVGIRSLAPRDWASVLSPAFLADPHNIRHGNMASVGIYNYHRGIEWLWLNQFFVEAELLCGDTDSAYWTYTHGQVHTALGDAGIGGLSELHDAHGSLGADFQAWSMASFLASLHAFSGVRIDALTRRIEVRPSLPACWPALRCRWRVEQTRFDVSCSPGTPGSHRVEVQTVKDAPDGYALRLGARLPAGARLRAVILNGEPLPSDQLQIIPGCAPDVAAEVWIETVLATHTSVEFQSD